MTARTSPATQTVLRMALLLNWRERGYARPHYGLVNDEELLRTGTAMFLTADGKQVMARRKDLLLLQHGTSDNIDAHQELALAI